MQDPFFSLTEVHGLADDVRRLFDAIERSHEGVCPAGSYAPAVDVLETCDAYEILVDLPGVAPEFVRAVIINATVIVAGEKVPVNASGADQPVFHLAERSFGRFARAVRLSTAIDAGRVRGSLRAGELRLVVPKIDERRGGEIPVPIERED